MNKRVTTFAILLALVLALLTPAAFAADEVAYGAQALDTNYALALAYIGREDYDKAMEWFLKTAEHGDTYAMIYIGSMYEDGKGVAQDYTKAMEWYQKAAELGDGLAKDSMTRLKDKMSK